MAPVRWWDGMQWTPHLSRPPVDFTNAIRGEERMWRWAQVGLVGVVFGSVGQAINAFSFAHTFHRVLHCAQVANQYTEQCSQFNGFSFYANGISDLLSLVTLGVAVPFLIWQHSAATVARGLGYPARTSPGFGVGSWFIPVVNFWFPYWALSDTLPPDHPLRGWCLWAWLLYLGSGLLYAGAFFADLASTSAAVILVIVGGCMTITAVVLGTRLVTAVREDHQHRLGLAP